MIVFSALVCPNPLSWQCEVRRDRLERFAKDLGLPVGQPFDLNRAAEVDVPPRLIARHHTRRSERNVSIADWMVAPASTSLAFILILTIADRAAAVAGGLPCALLNCAALTGSHLAHVTASHQMSSATSPPRLPVWELVFGIKNLAPPQDVDVDLPSLIRKAPGRRGSCCR